MRRAANLYWPKLVLRHLSVFSRRKLEMLSVWWWGEAEHPAHWRPGQFCQDVVETKLLEYWTLIGQIAWSMTPVGCSCFSVSAACLSRQLLDNTSATIADGMLGSKVKTGPICDAGVYLSSQMWTMKQFSSIKKCHLQTDAATMLWPPSLIPHQSPAPIRPEALN